MVYVENIKKERNDDSCGCGGSRFLVKLAAWNFFFFIFSQAFSFVWEYGFTQVNRYTHTGTQYKP